MKHLKPFLLNPIKTGAIAPSSAGLAKKMVEWINWDTADNVIEFGPGTGVFTHVIQEKLKKNAKFIAIEFNKNFAEHLREKFPDIKIIEDSIKNLKEICQRESIETIDAILSGIPWAHLKESFQEHVISETLELLKPSGQFATFAYPHAVPLPSGRNFKKLLKKYFTTVEKSEIVWANLPPAFIYRCTKAA